MRVSGAKRRERGEMGPIFLYGIIAVLGIAVIGLAIALVILLKNKDYRNRCAACGYRLQPSQLQCPHCGNRRLINEADIPNRQ